MPEARNWQRLGVAGPVSPQIILPTLAAPVGRFFVLKPQLAMPIGMPIDYD